MPIVLCFMLFTFLGADAQARTWIEALVDRSIEVKVEREAKELSNARINLRKAMQSDIIDVKVTRRTDMNLIEFRNGVTCIEYRADQTPHFRYSCFDESGEVIYVQML